MRTFGSVVLVIVGLVLTIGATPAAAHTRYADHVLARVNITSEAVLQRIRAEGVVLSHGASVGTTAQVVIPRNKLALITSSGGTYQIVVANVQAAVDAERSRLADNNAATDFGSWFSDFKTAAQIDDYLDTLAALAPDRVTVIDVGTSFEGRPIRGLHIAAPGTNNPVLLITGTQHAREWISPMVTTCFADALTRDYDTDTAISGLVDRLDVVIVPVVNPDGYAHTWTGDRFWRKNRNGNGVDLNRNWNVMWGLGSSTDSRNIDYAGTGAFSEPETAAIRDLATSLPNVVGFIDYHSALAAVLYPFAYTSATGEFGEQPRVWAEAMAAKISAVHGEFHDAIRPGRSNPTGGLAQDWFTAEQGIMGWTVELRGRDFVIDPQLIVPTCEENMAGLVHMAGLLIEQYGVDPQPDPDPAPDPDPDPDPQPDPDPAPMNSGGCTVASNSTPTTHLLIGLAILLLAGRRRK